MKENKQHLLVFVIAIILTYMVISGVKNINNEVQKDNVIEELLNKI